MVHWDRFVGYCHFIGILCRSLGLFGAFAYIVQRIRTRLMLLRRPYVLFSKDARHGLACRPGTSDIYVFQQIYVTREYSCLDHLKDDSCLIVDCGANVGYSSAYFLSRFPSSYVISVEPDPGNFEALEQNLAPYAGRYRAIRSAVWSEQLGLVLGETPRSGQEWARQVRPALAGEKASMQAIDIGTLLKDSGFARIRILKIDLERAEAAVFSANYESWLANVDNMVIELHGKECRDIFLKAIATESFDVSECGELTVCKRLGQS